MEPSCPLQNLLKNKNKLVSAILGLLIFGWLSVPALTKSEWQTHDLPDALGVISGTVLSEAGQPLVGIEVELTRRDGFYGGDVKTVTQEGGRYRANGLLNGIYTIRFVDPSYQHRETYYGNTESADEALEIPITGNQVEGIDVELLQAIGIAGNISILGDFAWTSYDVSVYAPDEQAASGFDDSPVASVKSRDLTGPIYGFTTLDPGRYRVCVNFRGARASDYVYRNYSECYNDIVTGIEAAEDIEVLAKTMVTGIDFVLGESKQYGAVSGQVTGPSGNPIANLRVVGYPEPQLLQYSRSHSEAVTDINGRYTLTTLLPITTTVHVEAGDSLLATEFYNDAYDVKDAKAFLVKSGDTINGIDIQLALKGGISGRILVQGEKAATHPTITLRRRAVDDFYPDAEPYYYYYRAYSDVYDPTTGLYTLEHLEPGAYLIGATIGDTLLGAYGGSGERDAQPVNIDVSEIKTGIDILLAEGQFEGGIEGSVTLDGVPAAGVQVQVLGPYTYGFYPQTSLYERSGRANNDDVVTYALTDDNGAYTIGGLTTSSYVIRFVPPDPGFATVIYRNSGDGTTSIPVEDGQIVSGIDANLERAGSIQGQIMRTDGEPAAQYEIVVEEDTPQGLRPLVLGYHTDDQGQYAIEQLPPGDYQLRFLRPHSGVTYLRLNVSVNAGEAVAGQNGVAGPGVPTSLPTVQEPSAESFAQNETLYVPFFSH